MFCFILMPLCIIILSLYAFQYLEFKRLQGKAVDNRSNLRSKKAYINHYQDQQLLQWQTLNYNKWLINK